MDKHHKRDLLVVLAFFILIWEFACYTCPSFISINDLLIRIWQCKSLFALHIGATLNELVIAIPLSIFLSFSLSVLFFSFRFLKVAFDPIFILFQTLPGFIVAPLFILCFGWSKISILTPIILLITFPLTTSIYKGLISTPTETVEYYTFCGLSKNKVLLHIRIPYSVPYFFSGVRIAFSSCVSYAVSGEFVGAQEGLGVLIQLFRREFDFVSLAASILILLALSLFFYSLALLLEKIFSWVFLYGSFKKNSISSNSFNILSMFKRG